MNFTKNLFNLLINDTTSEFFENARSGLAVYVKKLEAINKESTFIKRMEAEIAAKKELANRIPTTHAILVEVWETLAPHLRKCGGIVAGGFVSSYIKWDDNKIPGDMDIWLPSYASMCALPTEWKHVRMYKTGSAMPLNINCITEYTHDKYQLKLQFIRTSLTNPFLIVENFDFDVCKGVMSPGLDKDGVVIGVRATHPNIYRAIISNTATFLERKWDIDEEGLPNKKCLNRFIKYGAKGYKLAVHKDSKFSNDLIAEMVRKLKEAGGDSQKSSYDDVVNTDDSFSKLEHKMLFTLRVKPTYSTINNELLTICAYHVPYVVMNDPAKYEPTEDVDEYYTWLIVALYKQRAEKFKLSDKRLMTRDQLYQIEAEKFAAECAAKSNLYLNQVNLVEGAPPAKSSDDAPRVLKPKKSSKAKCAHTETKSKRVHTDTKQSEWEEVEM